MTTTRRLRELLDEANKRSNLRNPTLVAESINALPALLAVAEAAAELEAVTRPDQYSEGTRTWPLDAHRKTAALFAALDALNKEQP